MRVTRITASNKLPTQDFYKPRYVGVRRDVEYGTGHYASGPNVNIAQKQSSEERLKPVQCVWERVLETVLAHQGYDVGGAKDDRV